MAILATDKQDLKLDLTTGDLDLTGGRLNLSSGIAGIAQGAYIRVKQIKGEWFLNRTKGVPYFVVTGVVAGADALLGQKFDQVKFEFALRTVLEGSPGVIQVIMLQVTETKRTRRVASRWQLRTELGDTPVAELAH
jgi:hypothetical protein